MFTMTMIATRSRQSWRADTFKTLLLLLLPADTGFETAPLWGLAFALTLTGNVTAFFRAFCQLCFTPAIFNLSRLLFSSWAQQIGKSVYTK